MCGIALILSGARIVGFDLYRETHGSPPPGTEAVYQPDLSVGDLKVALRRRGPNELSIRKVFLQLRTTVSVEKDDDEKDKQENSCLWLEETVKYCISSMSGAVDTKDGVTTESIAELDFLGATLQLRGISPAFQPLVDVSGNILVFNGEIFGGLQVDVDSSDSETLLHALERCCSCDSELGKACSCIQNGEKTVPDILSTIRGPWALIYWQKKSKTLWFGRDAFGRRSLLVHWPTSDEPQFVLSSVSPASPFRKDSGSTSATDGFEPGIDSNVASTACRLCNWEELPCGIYSVHLKAQKAIEQCVREKLVGEVRKHEWSNLLLNELIKWERTFLDPSVEEFSTIGLPLQMEQLALLSKASDGMHHDIADLKGLTVKQANFQSDIAHSLMNNLRPGYTQPAEKVLISLRESVMRRTTLDTIYQTALHEGKEEELAPIALLFSGGLDSMILAVLLDQCLHQKYTVDLLNVSFDGQLAPDRVSARMGLRELQKIAPCRRWQLVEIDATLSDLTWEAKHVMSLIHPAKTYMDLNIGIALWLAAGGDGWVDGNICNLGEDRCRHRYKSMAQILLLGSGADEQCAGYGRHRTRYRLGGWVALHEEMRLDMQRIWKRNMGRDDRCISDHGKEARFPFLDEDVIKTLLEIPLWEIAELDKPSGRGDKKILREVARLLGLEGAAVLPKRAIQFGSRIARESNRKNFGCNRAANQASAGSVEIRQPEK
ncbi:asparagine synthetase domain-containing protein C4F6.11c isoform X1 [Phoenix dactylifera]|uniref:Asparagine synthetase domain-containing protein C4F6.11c isoform X1 n=1 Tax=Phoenix dactylifera TaxID=42345 RepID=A0A8B7BV22_PHODC|nr:asparagine synthetase domain-containing protein C4F6.11c isoform X1 [Phoenix dactylifera]